MLKWPQGMFAIEMVNGFQEMDSLKGKLSLPKAFKRVFRQPFVSTTYHDQHRHWKNATPERRDAALNGGLTFDGLWSVFKKGSSSFVD
jgi:hypothetical protein